MLSQQSGLRRDSGVGPGADQRGLQRDQPRCTSGDGPAPHPGDGSVNLLKSNGEMIDYNANALKEVLTVVNEIRELLDSGIKGMGFYLESTYINYCYFY